MQSTAGDGDIVAATVDGETTLKRLSMRGVRVVLKAENPAYPPIDLRKGTTTIHGVVVGLLRSYVKQPSSVRPSERPVEA